MIGYATGGTLGKTEPCHHCQTNLKPGDECHYRTDDWFRSPRSMPIWCSSECMDKDRDYQAPKEPWLAMLKWKGCDGSVLA